jgi:hypothetical protein
MSVAVLIQTEGHSLSGKRHQALVVPTESGAVTYARVTDGSKGKANAWSEQGLVTFHPDEYLTHEPVGIVLTAGDEDNLRKGSVSVLAQKALTALSKVESSRVASDADALLSEVIDKVASQDVALADWVRDGRRVNPLTMTRPATRPVVSGPTITPTAVAYQAPAQQGAPAQASCVLQVADPKFAKSYINRKVRGVSDFDMFDAAMKTGTNVLILGPTGSGKTTGAVAYASARGLPYFRVPGNQALEMSSMFGSYLPDGQGGWGWVDGPITALARQGGVLVLDEANLISAKILTDLYPLLDFGREVTLRDHGNEVVKAHPNLLIVATGNPNYAGTGLFSEAFKDRFGFRFLDWGYDASVERKLVKSTALRKMGKALRDKGEIETPVSTRLLTEFEETVGLLGWEFAVENVLDRFDDSEEREAVRGVVNTFKIDIRIDLGLDPKPVPVVETETSAPSTEGLADWERDLLDAPWDTK